MKKGFFVVVLALAIGMMLFPTVPAQADENAARSIFLDTFYGMAAGALIGSAISLAQDDPDWGKNVGTGAAIGGIAGALFGIVSEVRFMVEVEDGKVTAGLPRMDVVRRGAPGFSETVVSAGLLQYRF